MDLPRKMKEVFDEQTVEFQKLFRSAYKSVEELGLKFHPQDSPNVIAVHPHNNVNCVALWIKGKKGDRRIEGEVRVDGFKVDDLSTDMCDEISLHKYDRGKKPLWWITTIESEEDIERLCHIARTVTAKIPDWGNR